MTIHTHTHTYILLQKDNSTPYQHYKNKVGDNRGGNDFDLNFV